MNTILVPVSSPRKALNTLQYAIDLIQGSSSKIYLVKVYGVTKVAGSLKNIDDFLEAEADRDLENVIAHVDKKGVEIIYKSIKGDVKDSIKRVANQLNIDLIITGSKSDKKIFIGKTPGYLIKQTDLPVLFVPRHYKYKNIDKVLMAIKSGKLLPNDLLAPLKNVLKANNGKLELLRVITPDSTEEDTILDKELNTLQTNYFTSENETIYEGLKENIDKVSPDLICVIRRKRGFFKRLWENDKIYKKDFESKLPLLVLKGSE